VILDGLALLSARCKKSLLPSSVVRKGSSSKNYQNSVDKHGAQQLGKPSFSGSFHALRFEKVTDLIVLGRLQLTASSAVSIWRNDRACGSMPSAACSSTAGTTPEVCGVCYLIEFAMSCLFATVDRSLQILEAALKDFERVEIKRPAAEE